MSPSSWWTSKHPQSSSSSHPSNLSSKHRIHSKPVTIPSRNKPAKHGLPKPDASVTVTVSPIKSASSSSSSLSSSSSSRSTSDNAMSKGSGSRRLAPSSPPSTTTLLTKQPTSASRPVQIPKQATRDSKHKSSSTRSSQRRQPTGRDAHRPDSISPSVAALLAVTDIPRHRSSQRRSRKSEKSMTVSDIIEEQHVSEKELSLNLSGGGPLDLLLAPPDDVFTDSYMSASESLVGSTMTSNLSVGSVPSLGDSFATDAISSLESPADGTQTIRGRRAMSPVRKFLEPVRSPADAADEHPLSVDGDSGVDDSEAVADEEAISETTMSIFTDFKPLRAVFKSNLTASLRALRSAAKTFSGINFPSIPPDDFLTRSILTMDPKVPYADERRPPVMEAIPSAEMRRYLNPSTRTRLEQQQQQAPEAKLRPSSATSIQMQTYKVYRSRSNLVPGRGPYPAVSPQIAASQPSAVSTPDNSAVPGMRQREMRENPDFIRIAVMEMAMRKMGKLDSKKPGRAKWALAPRRTSAKPYEVGSDGVPSRWVPIACD